MARSRRQNRFSTHSDASSSTSTSPERGIEDDDNDSFMQQPNDSQSSLAASVSQESGMDEARREIEERCRLSPICRLPAELMIQIFTKLSSPMDLRNCMLVSKDWARNSVGILWHRPQTNKWQNLRIVASTVFKANGYFDYANFVKRLNLSALTAEVSDGTLDAFTKCKRIERLTLTNCTSLSDFSVVRMINGNRSLLALDVTGIQAVTDLTMLAVAKNCLRLQGLNITGCRRIYDASLEQVARNCKYLKRVS
jgi:F-box and leucine-rich repeat protein GRR1